MPRRLLLVAALGVLSGCGQSSPSPSSPSVVATVAGTAITQHQVDMRLKTTLAVLANGGAPTGNANMTARLRGTIIHGLIFDTVVAQEAAFLHVAVSDGDVETAFRQAVNDAGGPQQLETQLAALGHTDESLRDEIRSRLNEQRLEDHYAKDRVGTILNTLAAGGDFTTTV